PLQALRKLLERVLHRLGKLSAGLLHLLLEELAVGLGGVQLRLGVLAALLRPVPVALLDQLQRLLAADDRVLSLVPGLLAGLQRLLGGLIELLPLLEVLLVLVELR